MLLESGYPCHHVCSNKDRYIFQLYMFACNSRKRDQSNEISRDLKRASVGRLGNFSQLKLIVSHYYSYLEV